MYRYAEAANAAARPRQGGELYKLNPVDPQLETARFQPSNLSSEKPGFEICFFKLGQLVPLRQAALRPAAQPAAATAPTTVGGLYKLKAVDP